MNRQTREKNFRPGRLSFSRYFITQRQAFMTGLEHIRQSRWAAVMTCGVIGIAMALPAVFFVLFQNAAAVTENLNTQTQISLFLQPSASIETVQGLLAKLRLRADIAEVNYISPAEGLKELQTQSGLSNVLDQLPSNPLPPVIEVYPAASLTAPEAVRSLFEALRMTPGVESAKLDMEWVKRLNAIAAFCRQAVVSLGLLLALAVIFIIHHTIRLDTQNRHKEIDVLMLIGAAYRFIRRPFLYSGMLYGLTGGILAWFFVETVIFSLSFPASRLADLYHTDFTLRGLSISESIGLIFFSLLLGWLGSWSAVRQNMTQSSQKR